MIGYVLIGTFPWYVMECKLSYTNYPRIHEISLLKFVISKLGRESKRKEIYISQKSAHHLPYCLPLFVFLMVISSLKKTAYSSVIIHSISDDKVIFHYQKSETSIILHLSRPLNMAEKQL